MKLKEIKNSLSCLNTHFSISNLFYSFLKIWLQILFPFNLRNFSVSLTTDLLVMSYFSFIPTKNDFILSSLLKNIFVGYRNYTGLPSFVSFSFFFQHVKDNAPLSLGLHYFWWKVYWNLCHYTSVCNASFVYSWFQELFFTFSFQQLDFLLMLSLCWGSGKYIYIFNQIWKDFNNFFK